MARTKADLAIRVLKELRIIRRSGQAPSAADSTTVQDKYEDLLQELRAIGKASWDENSIPEHVFGPLSELVASLSASAFGTEYNAGDAYNRIVALESEPDSGEPVTAEYM
ncbi:MAG: hypothetical protein ACPHIA_08185 [Alphaproteobacteria bacterium]